MQREETAGVSGEVNQASVERMLPLAKPLLAETAGTFLMVFVGTGAIVLDQALSGRLGSVGIGVAFGLSVAAAIWLFGEVSGAHINPAVTLGMTVLGRFPAARAVPYCTAQLVGAVLASAALAGLYRTPSSLGATMPSGSAAQSMLVETVITFVLMFVIAAIAFGGRSSRLATSVVIGGTVGLLAAIAGPISGASMNPARSFGPALLSGVFSHHWIYWAGPIVGAALAAMAFRMLLSATSRKVS